MDLINRLKYYMDSIGASISQFADNCGIPRPSMSQLLNGRNKRISDDVINKIHAAYPDLSILWLMFGEGEMTVNNIKTSEAQNDSNLTSFDVQISDSKEVTNASGQAPQIPENPPENSYADNSLFETPPVAPEGERNTNFANSQKENINFGNQPSATYTHPDDITHTVFFPSASPQSATSSESSASSPQATSAPRRASISESKVSITPDSGKKITNIVVFYSDNSFQSFLPDV